MAYRIIGIMTGNSMDAIDLVLTEFDGDKMTDICSYSKAYMKQVQSQMESLRAEIVNKTRDEILAYSISHDHLECAHINTHACGT